MFTAQNLIGKIGVVQSLSHADGNAISDCSFDGRGILDETALRSFGPLDDHLTALVDSTGYIDQIATRICQNLSKRCRFRDRQSALNVFLGAQAVTEGKVRPN